MTEQIAQLLAYIAEHPRQPVGWMAGRLNLDEYTLQVLLNICVHKGWLTLCPTCTRTSRYSVAQADAAPSEGVAPSSTLR